LGLDVDGKRGTAGSETHNVRGQGPGEVDEVLLVDSHLEYILFLSFEVGRGVFPGSQKIGGG
jgi:hypothetical protein